MKMILMTARNADEYFAGLQSWQARCASALWHDPGLSARGALAMHPRTFVAALLCGLLTLAQAQQPPQTPASGVQESTDPARAAAIEKAAAALKQRPPQPAVEILRGKTEAGDNFLSGGVSLDHRTAMHAERQHYSLWVATVAKPSGAYLVDVELRIVRVANKAVVLQRKMEGPWLMLALPEGAYEVTGSFREQSSDPPQTLTMRVSVPKKGQRQAVLRFSSTATVDAEAPSHFKGNPFNSPPGAK